MPRRAVHLPCLLLSLGLASLWTTRPAAAEINCADAGTTVELNFCADKDYQAADKALNAAYESALAYIRTRDMDEASDKVRLEKAMRNAQRAWVAYRDSDCKDLVALEWSGGTGANAAILGCMTGKTIQRTKELNERYAEH
jgi:uncharacterized protein YecT (DUF1311 family)